MSQDFTKRELKLFASLVKLEEEKFEDLAESSKEFVSESTFETRIHWLNKLYIKVNNEITKLDSEDDDLMTQYKLKKAKSLLTNELLSPFMTVSDEHKLHTQLKAEEIIDLIYQACIESIEYRIESGGKKG